MTAHDGERGWYYAWGVDDFPQHSEGRLNGYTGPFASEHEAWVSYIEKWEGSYRQILRALTSVESERDALRAQLAERDKRLAAVLQITATRDYYTNKLIVALLEEIEAIARGE